MVVNLMVVEVLLVVVGIEGSHIIGWLNLVLSITNGGLILKKGNS